MINLITNILFLEVHTFEPSEFLNIFFQIINSRFHSASNFNKVLNHTWIDIENILLIFIVSEESAKKTILSIL